MVAPWERFRLANTEPVEQVDVAAEALDPAAAMATEAATRVVSRDGKISFAAVCYPVGVWLAGERVEVVCDGGLAHIHHLGVVVATHARRHEPSKQRAGLRRATRGNGRRRAAASTPPVTRKIDSSGSISFAGASYRVASNYARRQVQVTVVGDHVEISLDGKVIRRRPIRHDRTREHGALANPGGRPRRINAA